jgi:antitoxin VapB
VEIFRRGDEIVLRAKPASAAMIFDALASLPQDLFAEERIDTPPQQREPL